MGLAKLYGLSPSWLGQNQPKRNWVEFSPNELGQNQPKKGLGQCWPNIFFSNDTGPDLTQYFGLGQY